jgi:adenylate kinase family enzyme
LARRLSRALALPHLELDSIYHQAGWQPLPDEQFRKATTEFISQDRWVVDGNYNSHGVADIVWQHADTIIWLDLPRRVSTWRVARRTVIRALTREELWNGNREPLTNFYRLDPYQNVIVWSFTRHRSTREAYQRKLTDGTWAHANVIRLEGQRAVDSLLGRLIG